ncbi:gamma-glutamylcyclotransferase family protein [Roseomonas sp. GCM10028921]
MSPVFLYGTLLDGRILARRSGDPSLPRPAVLHGFVRTASRGAPYPTLIRRPGASVEGALVRPGPAARRRCGATRAPATDLCPPASRLGAGRCGRAPGWCRAS